MFTCLMCVFSSKSYCLTFDNKTDSNAATTKKGPGTVWPGGPDGYKL